MPASQCEWVDQGTLYRHWSFNLGQVATVRLDSALYIAATAGLLDPHMRAQESIVLKTVGGAESFSSGLQVPPSYGDFELYPQMVADGSGLHLFWAGVSTQADSLQQSIYPTTLYWTTFAAGGWTPQRVIFDEPAGIRWTSNQTADVVVDDSGILHVMFSESLLAPHPGRSVYLRKEGQRWVRGDPPQEQVAYLNLWAGAQDTLYAVTSGQGVTFIASLDGGHTWEKPVLVSQSGSQHSSMPDIALSSSGVLYVAWGKNLSEGFLPDVVWVSSSKDGGRTWSGPDNIEYGEGLLRDVDLVEQCGRMSLLIEVFRNPGDFSVLSSVQEDRGWSSPHPVAHGMGYSAEAADGFTDLVVITQEVAEDSNAKQGVVPRADLRLFRASGD